MRQISEIIVHCTATRAEWMGGSKTSAKVSEIRKWHKARGWSDIGYHYLIDRDGTIAKGRPVERVGAHVRGRNKGTIGVSLIGGHGSSENDAFEDNFTAEQDASLRGLLQDLKARHGVSRVSGHNQYAAKACPGFNVSRWIARKSPSRSSPIKSSTIQAAGGAVAAGAGGVATALSKLDPTAQYIVLGFAGVGLLCVLWIVKERLKKWAGGDR